MAAVLTPLVTTGALLALFVFVLFIVARESRRGHRFVLGQVRSRLDQACLWSERTVMKVRQRLGSLVYRSRPTQEGANVETLLRHATRTPLTVTYTNNHLSKMHDHKSDTALTPAQGKKLRDKKLEERF